MEPLTPGQRLTGKGPIGEYLSVKGTVTKRCYNRNLHHNPQHTLSREK